MRSKILRRLILRLTHRIWNREISRILCQAYEFRIINSEQMHSLAARFDPTQPQSECIYTQHHAFAVPVKEKE